jgi:hypothetical protein
MARLGVKYKASTAYHSQTNRQDKQLNQTLEQYLWNYMNYQQKNWVELLPIAQFTYNSSKNTTTGMTSFFISKGREPTVKQLSIKIQQKSYNGQLSAKQMKDLH